MKKHFWTLCMILCALSVVSCSKDEEDIKNYIINDPPFDPYGFYFSSGVTSKYCTSKTLFGGDEKGINYAEFLIPKEGGEFSLDAFSTHIKRKIEYHILPDAPINAADRQTLNDSTSYNVEPYTGDYFSTSVSSDATSIKLVFDENNTSADRAFWMFVNFYNPSEPFSPQQPIEIICITQRCK